MADIKSLIGRGPKFPFEPSLSGGLSISELIARINHSLLIIFDTRKGSRLNMPNFGSTLYQYRFDPLDSILIEKIRETIYEDVKKWEPRIILNATVTGNFVYPFRRDVHTMSDDSLGRW